MFEDYTQNPFKYKLIEKVILTPGNFYQFKYVNFENDPFPLIYYLNCVNSLNKKTGHFHRYIQGINFHYIPKANRLFFLESWLAYIEKNEHFIQNNFLKLWTALNTKYDFLKTCYRRYFTFPIGYINNIQGIKKSLIIPMVKGSMEQDFSFHDKLIFATKYREFNKVVNTNKKKIKINKK